MACGEWGYRWIWPDRSTDPRWSDPADTQSFLHDRRRPMSLLLNNYMKTYEQQTKESMTKFKKGDRVKATIGASRGRIGTIVENSAAPWVRFDDHRPDVYNEWRDVEGFVRGYMDCLAEDDLEPYAEPLSTTPDKVLQAAKTSPQAKDALKALFPDVFKDEPFEFGENWNVRYGCNVNSPIVIGWSDQWAPAELSRKCLVVNDGWMMKTQQYEGRTILTFHKKP